MFKGAKVFAAATVMLFAVAGCSSSDGTVVTEGTGWFGEAEEPMPDKLTPSMNLDGTIPSAEGDTGIIAPGDGENGPTYTVDPDDVEGYEPVIVNPQVEAPKPEKDPVLDASASGTNILVSTTPYDARFDSISGGMEKAVSSVNGRNVSVIIVAPENCAPRISEVRDNTGNSSLDIVYSQETGSSCSTTTSMYGFNLTVNKTIVNTTPIRFCGTDNRCTAYDKAQW
jgi:hypothetical protein